MNADSGSSGTVTRTTGIVGMDDPDQNLINEIINENNLPIIVTSDPDAPGVQSTGRPPTYSAAHRRAAVLVFALTKPRRVLISSAPWLDCPIVWIVGWRGHAQQKTALDAHSASANDSRCNRYRPRCVMRAELDHSVNL